jgi:hypothetical protein
MGRRAAPTAASASSCSRQIYWLFGVRNKYTHSAAYVPGASEADTPADLRGDTTVWLMDYGKSARFKIHR